MADVVRIEIDIETKDKTSEGVTAVVRSLKNLSREVDNAKQKVSKFDESATKTHNSLMKWAKERFQVVLDAKDKASPIIKDMYGHLKNIGGKVWSVTVKAIDLVTAPIRGIINLLKNPLLQAGAIMGVSFGIGDSLNTFKGFEAQMSQVKAISGATGAEFDMLTEKAKEMGATTKFTAQESAEAFNYMAMAGWKTNEMMSGIEGILSLAAASGEDLGKTSDIVTDALTAYGLAASDAGRFSDVLAAASSNSNTNVGMMGETFKYAAATAGSLHYSIEDTALAIGLMANAGIKSSMAGTALRNIMTRLGTNMNGVTDKLKAIGVNFYDAEGHARDFELVMDELRTAMRDMGDEDKISWAKKIAGQQGQAGLLAIINATTADYYKLKTAIDESEGSAKRMSDTMLDNLQGSFTILQSALDGVKISFGDRLAPHFRQFAEWLTDQMPAISEGIGKAMDFVDEKIEKVKKRFHDMMNSQEWKDADGFLGKAKVAWDKMIAEPFEEWWNGGGKQFMSQKASEIGQAIGTGISVGIAALLGIDLGNVVDEGQSIGASFASGFSEGMKKIDIGGALMQALGGMTKNAAKLLPGGESPDMSSLLSAALLAKIGAPMLSIGGSMFQIGKGMYDLSKIGGSVAGSFGSALSGGALTGAGATALGLGAAAGGAAMAVGTVDAVKNLSIALDKNTSAAESNARGKAGTYVLAGMGAGAATGAAIGSAFFGVGAAPGALIGGGIGAIGGMIGGHFEIKKYEQELAEQQALEAEAEAERLKALAMENKSLMVMGTSADKVHFSIDALNKAFADSDVNVEQFASMLQEAVDEDLVSRFGDVTLSMSEIQELANRITIDQKNYDAMNEFSYATEQAAKSVASLEDAQSKLAQSEWMAKASDKTEGLASMSRLADYFQAIQNMYNAANEVANTKEFEASSGMDMLLNANGLVSTESRERMMGGLAQAFDQIRQEMSEKYSVINEQFELVLSGQVSFENAEQIISDAQARIKELTDIINSSKAEAKIDLLGEKYGGADMSVESFSQLQAELKAQAEEIVRMQDEAYESASAGLRTTYKMKGIEDPDADAVFRSDLQKLSEGRRQAIEEFNQKSEDYQLKTVADMFGDKLKGSAEESGFKDDIVGYLKSGMEQAMKELGDPETWGEEGKMDIFKSIFKLDGMDGESQEEMLQLMSSIAATLPEAMVQALEEQDFTAAQNKLIEKALPGDDADFETPCAGVAKKLGEGTVKAVEAEMEGIETNAGDRLPVLIGDNIEKNKTGVDSGIFAARDYTVEKTQSVFNDMELTVNPTLHVEYNVVESEIKLNAPKAASGSTTVKKNAAGGITSGGPQLSWLNEEGPEAIIPLVPSRRGAALSLFARTAEILGVGMHAAGGIIGSNFDLSGADIQNTTQSIFDAPNGHSSTSTASSTNSPVSVNVNVSLSPNFNVDGGSSGEEGVLDTITAHLGEIADAVGGEIADRIVEVFSNTPVTEVG